MQVILDQIPHKRKLSQKEKRIQELKEEMKKTQCKKKQAELYKKCEELSQQEKEKGRKRV